MAVGWELQKPYLERKVIEHIVACVSDPDKLESAPVRPDNLIASRFEDGSLPDL